MEQENAKTGKLREDTFIPGTTGDLYKTPSGSIPPVIYPVTGEMNTGTEPTQKTYHPSEDVYKRQAYTWWGYRATGIASERDNYKR